MLYVFMHLACPGIAFLSPNLAVDIVFVLTSCSFRIGSLVCVVVWERVVCCSRARLV